MASEDIFAELSDEDIATAQDDVIIPEQTTPPRGERQQSPTNKGII